MQSYKMSKTSSCNSGTLTPKARNSWSFFYALTGKTWSQVLELRARRPDRHVVIRYDRDIDASAGRAWRQALG